jgi:hypothetical protein
LPFVAPLGTVVAILVAVQLVVAAVVPLNVTVPGDPRFVPVIVTAAPTAPEVIDRLEILGAETTVKLTPLLSTPLAWTTTFPVDAPEGTITPMLAALQLLTVAVVPLNLTVLVPCVEPKLEPLIVTAAPIAPVVIERLEIPGVGNTVKLTPLLSTPLAWTTTFPVVAPDGTVTPMAVAVQLLTVAVVPLNLTVLVPCVEPKFEPLIVTAAPTAPLVTDKLEMLGAGSTVKVTPLLALFDTVTTTLPVVAPVGTVTTMLEALQLVAVAVVPLNLTVLEPCEFPKPDPAIVTLAPTAPVLGVRVEIVGPTATTICAVSSAKVIVNTALNTLRDGIICSPCPSARFGPAVLVTIKRYW